MLSEFKTFIIQGNAVDLAVGIVIGTAFTAVVNALVGDILTPLISGAAKLPDFSSFVVALGGAQFKIGHFLNATISFLLVAAAIFFFVVKPMNALASRKRSK